MMIIVDQRVVLEPTSNTYGSEQNMVRPIVVVVIVLLTALLVIPAVVVQFIPHGAGQVLNERIELEPQIQTSHPLPNIQIAVYRTSSKTIENVPLESYIRGVVASEMPAEFELEALKAQALAARTYIIRRLVDKDLSDAPEGSIVTDTEKHQVYQSETELQERWGIEYERKISRINQAINETVGQVLTYEGRPINATYFSTSNGYTENSEDYWSTALPYLRSVASPWDKDSPRYKEQIKMGIEDFQKYLGINNIALPAGTNQSFGEVLSRTTGNRINQIQIGDQIFTGKEVRELLDLSSSDFEWKLENSEIIISTIGWGHGVGMSQWGANGMAAEGHTYEQIVKYYYKDVQIQDYRQWIVKK
jgi:stage II sporulation protein D